jgi:hypothetical protein
LFAQGGKKVRPTMVVLMSAATNANTTSSGTDDEGKLMLDHTRWFEHATRLPCFAAQRRLAEVRIAKRWIGASRALLLDWCFYACRHSSHSIKGARAHPDDPQPST